MPRSPYLYLPLLAVLLVGFWLHALLVPFWQDDFHLLLLAREARDAGESWFAVLWPAQKSIFWRPLSEGIYWRLVEGMLGANPLLAHALNLLFLVASAIAVGWLVADCATLIDRRIDARRAFLMAGFLYGIHAAHLLPALWATAVHTSMAVLFSALALRFWVAALRDPPMGFGPGLLSVPVFLLLALFSKENGIMVLPLGALLTATVWDRARPTRVGWVVAAGSVLMALAWLAVRQRLVVPPSGAYEMGIGTNTIRNLASMILFFFNVPRESLRFMLEQQSAAAAFWAFICAMLQAAAVWIVLAAERSVFGFKGAMAAAAFFLVAGAPHLLLSWNSYAYYISLGLIVWPLLAVLAPLSSGRARLVLAAALLSSGLSVAGNYALGYPALLARAEWADRQIAIIQSKYPKVADRAQAEGIDVVAENRHRFLAIGVPGLAFALGLSPNEIRELAPDASDRAYGVKLLVPDGGDAYFE